MSPSRRDVLHEEAMNPTKAAAEQHRLRDTLVEGAAGGDVEVLSAGQGVESLGDV